MKRAFLFFIVLLSCGVKQPVEVSEQEAFGSIYVTAGQMQAQIFLDGENTAQVTPDTLKNVSPGQHSVSVRKNGYSSIPDSLVIHVEKNQLAIAQFELVALSDKGYVLLSSFPSNAPIFVDDVETGLTTPDTLTLEIGDHIIELRKNGYLKKAHNVKIEPESYYSLSDTLQVEQRVLLEGFANVSCNPCVAAAINLHDFNGSQQSMPFIILEYYVNWPSPNDPFYLESPEQINERVRYYSITGVPAVKIDGTVSPYPGNYGDLVQGFEQAARNHNSKYGISIDKTFSQNHLVVNIEILSFDKIFDNPEEKLFVAIRENDIHFNSPPGSNGLKDFSFVFRKFLTSEKGDDLPQGSNQATFTYEFEWQGWDYANCQVVAFIQNRTSKRVIQTAVN